MDGWKIGNGKERRKRSLIHGMGYVILVRIVYIRQALFTRILKGLCTEVNNGL